MKKFWVVMIAFLGAAAVIGGCSPRVVEKVIKETDTVRVTDSIIVNTRPVTVPVDIPESSQSVILKDTSSHLEDALYESDAYWDGEFLHHSLNNKPGANLQKIIEIHDTVKVKDTKTSHNKEKSLSEKVYIKPTLKDKAGYYVTGFIIGILISVVYGARKKISGIIKKLG